MLVSSRGEEDSSPLATVEEIQRRLIRPSSPSSTIDSSDSFNENVGYGSVSQFRADLTKIERDGELDQKKKKLEDYLDPILLSTISSEMRSKRDGRETKQMRISKDFEWPVEELKAFVEGSRTEKRSQWSNNGAVNLNDDIDGDAGHDDEDDGCNPFRRLEGTIRKLF